LLILCIVPFVSIWLIPAPYKIACSFFSLS
jgi:hypothetical protein